MAEVPEKMEVFFHKSNFFRVIHADGCHGGVTPRGSIHMGFFSERVAYPLRTEFPILNGKPGPESVIEAKKGLVRELEADIVMDLNSAAALYVWLGEKVDTLRKAMGVSDVDWNNVVGGKK